MAVDTPHFDLPFRFGKSAVVVEQDTLDDVANCVETVVLVHTGYRSEVPTFGMPDLAFFSQPIGRDFLTELIVSQVPRAAVAIAESPDRFDELIDRVLIEIGTRGVNKS